MSVKLKFLCKDKNVGSDKSRRCSYMTCFSKDYHLKVLIFLESTKNDYFSHQISKKSLELEKMTAKFIWKNKRMMWVK